MPENCTSFEPGMVVILTHGDYDGYSIEQIIRVLKSFTAQHIGKEYLALFPRQRGWYAFEEDVFVEWLARAGYAEVVKCYEFHISDYTLPWNDEEDLATETEEEDLATDPPPLSGYTMFRAVRTEQGVLAGNTSAGCRLWYHQASATWRRQNATDVMDGWHYGIAVQSGKSGSTVDIVTESAGIDVITPTCPPLLSEEGDTP